ncbi:transmembrane protein 19 [Chironomus tepperi]|uniref:transmembrane protein 19 n=1 Tax=Chironomus tepperi TaxID=113505 RepID=UPI00391F5C1D
MESANCWKLRDLICVLVSVPVSLIIWILGKSFSTFSNTNDFSLTPLRSFLSTFFPFLFMIYGYKKRSVNRSGAIFGIIVALLMAFASPVYLIVLATFFFSSSKATKYRQDFKKKIEKDFKVGGQRNWVQVLCNGGVGGFIAIAHLLELGVGERPIDFVNNYNASLLGISFLASIACVTGDTWSSELGIFSTSDPVLITNIRRRVPKGTNGGVSKWGFFVSFLGGLLIGFSYYISTIIFIDRDLLIDSPPQYPIILMGGIAGLLGSAVDSFLGATCQFSGQTPEGFIVEEIEEKVIKISGRKILNNHSVNLLSCIFTAIAIPVIAHPFWNFFTLF